jgi:hypothetical protein
VTGPPDYLAPVSGWRTWRIETAGPEARLASVVRGALWPLGEPIQAACSWIGLVHPPPGRGCRCGIHVARDPAEAAFHAQLPSGADQPLAIGLAALWGRVVEGRGGWRGALAYPETLYVIQRRPGEAERAGALAWDLTAYGVPAGVLDCSGRGVLEALLDTAPAARRPRPAPLPLG